MTDKSKLRAQAEARFAQLPEDLAALSPEETRNARHELRVHQIELEMQNEELRRAQVELDASRARYFDLYDEAPVSYCTLSKEGLILEANLATTTLLGVVRSALIKQLITRFIQKDDQTLYFLHRKHLFETGQPQTCELRMVKKDGTTFWANLAATAVQDDGGAPTCRIVMSDITERKRAEEALRESNRKLQEALKELQDLQSRLIQQERLSALGQMASGIAHDFNNALMPILGFTDILLSEPGILDNRKETVEMLQLVHTGAEGAAETVRRLQEFYRPPALSKQDPVDLSGVIQDTVVLTQPKWKEGMQAKGIAIDIRTEIAPVPPVMGDENELGRLLTNLIFNAVDAMPKGGSITIRLHPHALGKHAVLEVQDTGVGMTEEVRCRCLDPFFTTKSGRGVGLGLSVSHGIVLRHKGSIGIQSESGKGTKVIVQLPLMESPRAQPQEKQKPPPDRLPPGPSLRVLFVDDEGIARHLLRRYLEADGYTVKLAADGREGLASFEAGRFDVVILDRAMPGMNGDELTAAIKARSPETPVIMLTGFGNIMGDQDEHPVGVDMVMTKPLTREDLRCAIAEIMARKPRIL